MGRERHQGQFPCLWFPTALKQQLFHAQWNQHETFSSWKINDPQSQRRCDSQKQLLVLLFHDMWLTVKWAVESMGSGKDSAVGIAQGEHTGSGVGSHTSQEETGGQGCWEMKVIISDCLVYRVVWELQYLGNSGKFNIFYGWHMPLSLSEGTSLTPEVGTYYFKLVPEFLKICDRIWKTRSAVDCI